MPDYSEQNLAVTQAWEREEARREAASQEAEERMEVMRYTPHRFKDDPWGPLYCDLCGTTRDAHGEHFPR